MVAPVCGFSHWMSIDFCQLLLPEPHICCHIAGALHTIIEMVTLWLQKCLVDGHPKHQLTSQFLLAMKLSNQMRPPSFCLRGGVCTAKASADHFVMHLLTMKSGHCIQRAYVNLMIRW
jgi:hypothetical protein